MTKLTDVIKKYKITMSLESVRAESLPRRTLEMWPRGSFHYNAVLKTNGGQFTTEFHTGPGWAKQPAIEDVLDSLFHDARAFKDHDFSSFSTEFGYTDPAKANYAWKGCEKSYNGLQRLFGAKLDKLIDNVECL